MAAETWPPSSSPGCGCRSNAGTFLHVHRHRPLGGASDAVRAPCEWLAESWCSCHMSMLVPLSALSVHTPVKRTRGLPLRQRSSATRISDALRRAVRAPCGCSPIVMISPQGGIIRGFRGSPDVTAGHRMVCLAPTLPLVQNLVCGPPACWSKLQGCFTQHAQLRGVHGQPQCRLRSDKTGGFRNGNGWPSSIQGLPLLVR